MRRRRGRSPEDRLELARLTTELATADPTIALEPRRSTSARRRSGGDPDGRLRGRLGELAELNDELVERIFAVRAASHQRRAGLGSAGGAKDADGAMSKGDDGDGSIPVTAFVTFFERPPR